MKVYVLMEMDIDETGYLWGVYSTKKKAEIMKQKLLNENIAIDELKIIPIELDNDKLYEVSSMVFDRKPNISKIFTYKVTRHEPRAFYSKNNNLWFFGTDNEAAEVYKQVKDHHWGDHEYLKKALEELRSS